MNSKDGFLIYLIFLFRKFRAQRNYLFFGVLTTLVNYVVYFISCALLPSEGTTIPNVISWVCAVLFAFLTNRQWVFYGDKTLYGFFRELISFAFVRLATLIIETLILYIFVDILGFGNIIIKLIANIIVVVLNYIFSKYVVFVNRTHVERN